MRQFLLIHALSGCDTTSALFGIGKVSAFHKITGKRDSVHLTEIFSSDTVTSNDVAEAGVKLLVMLYGGKADDNLNSLRHSIYKRMCSTSASRPLPGRLPPTQRAAYYHCLRIYLQVSQWRNLDVACINATEWGWKIENNKFLQISTDQQPAPEEILKIIRCSCKSSSKNQCGTNVCTCRKNGLPCVSACGDCHSNECLNAETVVVYNDDVTADNNSDTEDLFDEPLQTTDELAEQICFLDEVFEWEGKEEVVLSVAMNIVERYIGT